MRAAATSYHGAAALIAEAIADIGIAQARVPRGEEGALARAYAGFPVFVCGAMAA